MLAVARTTFRDIEEEAAGCDITLPIEDYLDMIGALARNTAAYSPRASMDKGDLVHRYGGRLVCGALLCRHVRRRHAYSCDRSTAVCRMLHAGLAGITDYDLMGIGSDFAPSLKGLNEFKTKFTETITPVAPARDVPLKKVFYKTLQAVQGVRRAFRQ